MRHKPTAFLFSVAVFAQSGGQPVTLPIQNPSFEQGTTGWTFGSGSSVAQYNGAPAAVAGYRSSFSQTLPITPEELQRDPRGGYLDGVYVLHFSVVDQLGPYSGYYTAELDFGTQELCDWSGWGTSSWGQVTHVCLSPGYIVVDASLPGGGPVQGKKQLTLKVTVDDKSANGGWPLFFRAFAGTFNPQ